MHCVKALLVAAGFAVPAVAQDETPIPFEEVPPHVMDAAIATAPGVTFDRVSIEIEDGVPIYEFEAQDHTGKRIEIDVFEDGSIEEIEMEIAFEEVPAAVLEALEKAAPGFQPSYIELSVRENNTVFVYEFEGEYQGQAVDIQITEDGELLAVSAGNLS